MSRSDGIVCGLDVGTTKICAIIGELNADGVVDIIGVGTSPSRGLRRGVVVNIDLTVSSIKKLLMTPNLWLEDVRKVSSQNIGRTHQGDQFPRRYSNKKPRSDHK